MRNFDHWLSRGDRNLIIFIETSGMIEPGEGAFNHPAPRKLLPLVGFDFLWNINVETELFLCIRNESAPISSICAELLDRWISFVRSSCSKYPAFCVMNISGMNHNRQQADKRTSTTMCRFLPFVFPSVNPAFFAGCYCFHTLGINDRIAWTLLTSSICSCLFYKMLQNFIPQPTDPEWSQTIFLQLSYPRPTHLSFLLLTVFLLQLALYLPEC